MTTEASTGDLSGLSEGLQQVHACLFCGSSTAEPEAEGVRDYYFNADDGAFRYMRCVDCKSLWLTEQPMGDRLAQAYAAYYTHSSPVAAPPPRSLRKILRSGYVNARFGTRPTMVDRAVATLTRLAGKNTQAIDAQFRFTPKAPAKVLDYGCGSGEYLLRMQPFGHEVYGAEYDPHLLDSLAAKGITMTDVAILSADTWSAEFDHITLSHVLEHVPDPVDLLTRLFGWLKPEGTLYLELPNGEATGLDLFGRYWRGLEAPRHFALPSRAALARSLEDAGFNLEIQHIVTSAREWVWAESLKKVEPQDLETVRNRIANAPAENFDNAEFLTMLARKPAP